MRSDLLLAALTTAGSCIAGSSADLEKRSFSVDHSTAGNEHRNGAEALRRAYLKYGIEVPKILQERQTFFYPANTQAAKSPQGTEMATEIAVTERNDLEYLSPVKVGGKVMRMDFDTGSSDLWVFSDKVPLIQRNGHAFYDTNSTGQEKAGFSWKISYGDGSGASGVVYADKVTVGSITATAQAVEAATSVSTHFVNEHSDGLLGLGFGLTNTVKPNKQKTFFENIKPMLIQPVFAVTLRKNASGTYDFGYIDPKKYVEPIQYIPVNTTRGYWEYTATGYAVGNAAPVVNSFQAIADTGTTLMLMPQKIVQDYYAQVPGAAAIATEGGFAFPCNSHLPDLKLMMGTVTATVQGQFMNRSLSQTGSGLCFGGLQMGQPNLSIWGDVFLKSQYVVFDGAEPPRIGFAKQAAGALSSLPAAGNPSRQQSQNLSAAGPAVSSVTWIVLLFSFGLLLL